MTPRPHLRLPLLSAPFWMILSATSTAFAATPGAPEAEALLLSKKLRPIPDDQWSEIAGDKATERYEIARGDTLYAISKRLFGDGKYWPKIWALNNGTITNPHWIKPRNLIAFLPGTGTSLPAVTIESSDGTGEIEVAATVSRSNPSRKGRSEDWKHLPTQSWESVNVTLPPEVDPQGFDLRNRYEIPTTTGFELDEIAASDEVPFLGSIRSSQSAGTFLTMGDIVYITPDSDNAVQVGETYAITVNPHRLSASDSSRKGFAYPILGKVRITDIRDGLTIGTIVGARSTISRGNSLIPVPARARKSIPVAAPAPQEAVLMLDRQVTTDETAQHHLAFVDRGSDDGIQLGMVFRAYQHRDPNTGKKISDSDLVIDGDLRVVQVTPQFSTVLVTRSEVPLQHGSRVVLLTDVSDLTKPGAIQEKGLGDSELTPVPGTPTAPPQNDLDALDEGGDLGKDEAKELQQLEEWKETPAPPPPPPSEPPPPGTEELPPPPTAPVEEPTENAFPATEPPPAEPPPLPPETS